MSEEIRQIARLDRSVRRARADEDGTMERVFDRSALMDTDKGTGLLPMSGVAPT